MNDVKTSGRSFFDDNEENSTLNLDSVGDFWDVKVDKPEPSAETEDTLDLDALSGSSLSENGAHVNESGCGEEKTYGDSLFECAVKMLETREVSVADGAKLLEKSAKEGNAEAYIYLGKLFGDEQSVHYDPTRAFGYFLSAVESGLDEGYYYLGLCYLHGIGCKADEARAAETLLKGGELGNARCITTLGICCERGVGCELDYAMSVKLYERAAESSDPIALNNLGGCYFYGHGVVQDKERAVSLYAKAHELGNLNATCRLGICLEEGDGCERDIHAAFSYYKKAAESGHKVALYRLAQCYENGIGTEQNFARAYSNYNKSASRGYAPAMYKAGMMSLEGRGTKKNAFNAYKMLSAAGEEKLPDALYEEGNCYLEGKGTVKNAELAYLRYLEAYESEGAHGPAAFKLGICNLKGLGTAKDPNVAFEWFCRGVELGSSEAAYMKGECYFFGVGVPNDPAAAIDCYKEAISDRMSGEIAVDAYIALAICLEYGTGTQRDLDAALEFYKLASDRGSASATYDFGRILLSGAGTSTYSADARTYVLRAARSEYPSAMLAMGIFADEGRGVAKNAHDAERWYTKTVASPKQSFPSLTEFPERFYDRADRASRARVEAQYRLGLLLTRKDPASRSYVSAFENIAFAASLGHAGAQREISGIYLSGGDLKTYYENASFERSGEAPVKEVLGSAMNKLGDAYFDGKALVKKNEAAAARCYKTAAENGDVDGAYSYGWCLRHGVGINENDSEAVKWLKSAADRGSINAAYSYGLCCEEGSGTGIKNKREARSYYRKAAAAGHIEAARRYMALSGK